MSQPDRATREHIVNLVKTAYSWQLDDDGNRISWRALHADLDMIRMELEDRIETLEVACKGGEVNTILLMEYATPIYDKHGFSLTAIAQALEGKPVQRDCDNCALTGLLCPIRNNDTFVFPCLHWKALEGDDDAP